MYTHFGGTQWCNYFYEIHQQRSDDQNNLCFLISVMRASALQLSWLDCCMFIVFSVSDKNNNVIPGFETQGSLHVVTGSNDSLLRLFKVNTSFFAIIFKSCLFFRTFIYFFVMFSTSEVGDIDQCGSPTSNWGIQNSLWTHIFCSKCCGRPFQRYGNDQYICSESMLLLCLLIDPWFPSDFFG
jgi:hypothetical protein